MKKKEIVLVIIVIAFGIIYNLVESGDWKIFEGININTNLKDEGPPVLFPQETIRIQNPGQENVGKIKINNPAGDIEVVKSLDGSIEIKPVIRVYYKDEVKAEKLRKRVKINKVKKGDALRVRIESAGRFPYRRVRVGIKCSIPEGIDVDLRNKLGNVSVTDVGQNVVINQAHGDLFVKNIQSTLKVKSEHGLVRLYDIAENIELSAGHATVKIKNTPSLALKGSHSKITVHDVPNGIHVPRMSYCKFSIENSGKVEIIRAIHSSMDFNRIRGDVIIKKNSFEPISLGNINGDVFINGKHCELNLFNIEADDLVIRNSYSSTVIQHVSCNKVKADIEHGDIELAFDRIDDNVDIKADHGTVSLWYPETLKPGFNITAKNGDIINRTSGDLNIEAGRRKDQLQSSGTPEIRIFSGHGDVILSDKMKPEQIKAETESFEETGKNAVDVDTQQPPETKSDQEATDKDAEKETGKEKKEQPQKEDDEDSGIVV